MRPRHHRRRVRFALLGLLIACTMSITLSPGSASAATLTVCAKGCTSTTIQDAIKAAAASGDTIKIAAGTYFENLSMGGKNLSLAGAGATTIDGGGNGRVVTIFSGSVTISGVTIKDGVADGGGGISSGGALTLNNSTVTANTAGQFGVGGGIQNTGTMTLNNSTVTHNTSGLFSGGILNVGTATLNNSAVTGNTAGTDGGGIRTFGTMTLNNSAVTRNTAGVGVLGGSGGGIFSDGLAMTLNNSTVTRNTAVGGGGGGILTNDGTMTLSNSAVRGNCPARLGADGQLFGDVEGPAPFTFTQKNSTVGPPGPCPVT